MAKKAAAPKNPATATTSDCKKNLVDAIVTVRHLQDFIKENGGLERALGAVGRVSDLVTLTGGFDALKQALEIVGKEEAPVQA